MIFGVRFVRHLRLLLALAVLMPILVQQSAAQIAIVLQHPALNQLKASDLWSLSVTNTSDTEQQLYLLGSVTEQKDGKLVEARSAAFTLKAHATRIFGSTTIGSVSYSWKNNKYRAVLSATGEVPAGEYTICIAAFASADNKELGKDCIEHSVEQNSAPVLVAPENASVQSGKNISFSWLPPAPAPRRVSYNLKIVELAGGQSPQEAIRRNPAYFQKSGITTSSFLYPFSARPFVAGKSYAWQINLNNLNTAQSASEVWTFTIAKEGESKMLTRQEAIDIVLRRVVNSPALDHPLTAYLSLAVLPANTTVMPFMEEDRKKVLTSPVWFAWINDAPQAFFEHPTRFVFIDAYTGKCEISHEQWWAVVNGESLWMSDEEKTTPEVLIYSDIHRKE